MNICLFDGSNMFLNAEPCRIIMELRQRVMSRSEKLQIQQHVQIWSRPDPQVLSAVSSLFFFSLLEKAPLAISSVARERTVTRQVESMRPPASIARPGKPPLWERRAFPNVRTYHPLRANKVRGGNIKKETVPNAPRGALGPMGSIVRFAP